MEERTADLTKERLMIYYEWRGSGNLHEVAKLPDMVEPSATKWEMARPKGTKTMGPTKVPPELLPYASVLATFEIMIGAESRVVVESLFRPMGGAQQHNHLKDSLSTFNDGNLQRWIGWSSYFVCSHNECTKSKWLGEN